MIERILEFMKERNLSPSQFADEIGIQRSGMSHLISGRNKPSLEFIMKVLKRFPEVKAEYLLYGTTEDVKDEILETGNKKEAMHSKPVTLFDQPDLIGETSQTKPTKPVKRDREERKMEKIVIFYNDRTFREYLPEQGS
jgi:transcriptional regulator with XRE-family HTH domain